MTPLLFYLNMKLYFLDFRRPRVIEFVYRFLSQMIFSYSFHSGGGGDNFSINVYTKYYFFF